MAQSPWRTGLAFALIGPLLGLGFALTLVTASGAIARTDLSMLDQALAMLTFVPMLLIAAYVIGAPAAFAVGATTQALIRRGVNEGAIIAASVAIGAAISMLLTCGLDEFVLPHPHGDAAPLLGLQMWLTVGGIGGVAAAVCSIAILWRRRRAAYRHNGP